MTKKTHKLTEENTILCNKVPKFSDASSAWKNVTCKYCLKLNKKWMK